MEEDAKMIDEVTECPYVVGNRIILQLEGRPVQATIVKTFEPWTQSCAMVLSFDSDLSSLGIKGNVVLKIYDRRFSTKLRSIYKIAGPWTPEIERDLYEFLCSDKGMEFAIEYEKACIKQREEDYCFMPTIIEEDTEEQEQQNTCEQEGINGNDNFSSKGNWYNLSMISNKLLFPLLYAYKVASRGLFCAIRLFLTGITAVVPWGRHKVIDIETQHINRKNEVNGDNSTKNHGTTGEQQTNNLDAAVDDAGGSEDEEGEWDHRREEIDAYVHKQFYYESELEAYETMKDLQDISIPRMFARTKILGPKCTQGQRFSRYFEHPGILMEYIEGFPLPELPKNAPKKAWQPIVDKAIEIVNEIMRHGVLNDDTNVRCFIVQPDPANDPDLDSDSEYKFKLAMIDFGHTRFRRQYLPGEDWRWWEAQNDAEGAIGLIMHRRLGEVYEGVYLYEETPYCKSLQHDYMREECSQERPTPRTE
ncbi:hypothetical protein N7497_007089 [Penicillium chrysogenum]|uniref:Protein kinase domain-containing protein n=1 Tax=Penicillium chrysogenum TaxID=5076 RepID=A0ABQ8W424_PENCH|nr:hypothetical protein N7505_010576 [Penicillium chrysogenum]KAJ6152770.1 hypothetical protein N7497_007089 [Penicillium chrysogenum]